MFRVWCRLRTLVRVWRGQDVLDGHDWVQNTSGTVICNTCGMVYDLKRGRFV